VRRVDARMEKCAKLSDALAPAGNLAMNHIENAREQHHERGPEEESFRKQYGREDVHDQAKQGENVGVDPEVREPIDKNVEDPLAAGSNSAADRWLFGNRVHASLSCMVVKARISKVRVPDGILTSTVSPSRLFSR